MNHNNKILLAGHTGMLGSAILHQLRTAGFSNVITVSTTNVDLRDQRSTIRFFQENKPDFVILAAAKVGGIWANINYPAEFLYDNLMIEANVFESARLSGVKKILFLSSSCVYPKQSPQPMKEEYLLSGAFEPTNEGYAIAKIVGMKLAEFYEVQYGISSLSLIPCNLYGEKDNFDPDSSHVLSALIRKFSEAMIQNKKELVLWGTGRARREFMHVDDCAAAVIHFLDKVELYNSVNIGWGTDISIYELAVKIASKIGYEGRISWDDSKPDGMSRKCLDVSNMIASGFHPKISLDDGIDRMLIEYSKHANRR